jgi:hypothetical protein
MDQHPGYAPALETGSIATAIDEDTTQALFPDFDFSMVSWATHSRKSIS